MQTKKIVQQCLFTSVNEIYTFQSANKDILYENGWSRNSCKPYYPNCYAFLGYIILTILQLLDIQDHLECTI